MIRIISYSANSQHILPFLFSLKFDRTCFIIVVDTNISDNIVSMSFIIMICFMVSILVHNLVHWFDDNY